MIWSLQLWWTLAATVRFCECIDMLDVLKNYPDLSTISSLVASSPIASDLLSTAQGFTFLAPSNNAIANFNKQDRNFTVPGMLEAIVQYSLLPGVYSTLSFSETPQFAPTYLNNLTFANVTGGQVVGLVEDSKGNPTIVTGNTTITTTSSTDLVSIGGLIHIVEQVPTIPAYAVMELTSARLEYFISILSAGNFLSPDNILLTMGVMLMPDVTFFVPNSAGALDKFKKLASKSSHADLQAIWQYHYVPSYLGYSSQLQNGTNLTTAQGSEIIITKQGGDTYVNGAKIVETDILCANGVIHVLDDLLDRNNITPPPKQTVIAITSSSTSPTETPTVTAIPTTSQAPVIVEKAESNTSLKIGLGVGCSAAGLLAIAAIFFFLRYRSARTGGFWDGTPMDDTSKYYLNRGQVKKHEDLGLGLGSTAMRDIHTADDASSRPIVTLRS